MSINSVQLRAFHAVATHRSFTRAAQALHLTQPTLSDHVRALEQRYGVKLFERRGRGVVPTGLGEALHEITRRQFALEDEAERLLAAARGVLGGHLRVAADSPYLVLPLLGGFHRRYPHVELALTFGNSEQVLSALLQQRSDIAVLPEPALDEKLFALPLQQDRLVLLAPIGHAWSKRRSVRLTELSGERVIVREPGSTTRAVFEQALRAHGVRPADLLEIGSREAVREAVAAGLGIGVIGASEVGSDTRLHLLGVRDVPLQLVEYIVSLKVSRQRGVVDAFFRYAADAVAPSE